MTKICRLCLVEDREFIDLLSGSLDADDLLQIVRVAFSLFIDSTDVSTLICYECILRIKEYYKFYLLVQKSQSYFRNKNVNVKNEIKSDDIYTEENNSYDEGAENKDDFICDSPRSEGGWIKPQTDIVKKKIDLKCKKSNINIELIDVDEKKHNFPKILIKKGKFIVKGSRLEDAANKFFNLRCYLCENRRKFDGLSKMMKHFEEEHKTKGFVVCCNTRLYRREIIFTHMARHIQPTAFECTICKKRFTRLNGLKQHLETHLPEEERSYKCDQCGKGYVNITGLNYHKIMHIPMEQRKKYECKICNKIYYAMSSYSCHTSLMHSSPKFVCSECGKRFASKRNYEEHLEVHDDSGANKVQCQHCGFLCKNKASYRSHVKLHNVDRLKCSICEFTTHRKALLNRHMSVKHSNDKPFVCVACGKQFKLKSILNDHMALHTGEKKFVCEYCPKSFATSGNYYTHRKKMHAEELKNDMELKQKERTMQVFDTEKLSTMKTDDIIIQELARKEIQEFKKPL